jgi:hypothetical protein
VVQRAQNGQGPPQEEFVPDDIDELQYVPFDFFGLGQPIALHNQNQRGQNQHGQQQDGQQQNQQNADLGQIINQANIANQWVGWPNAPAQLQAQAEQIIGDLNGGAVDPNPLNLNNPVLDPFEVIINP